MIIHTVWLRNYHSIRDETLHCENLTALVGVNGSGKSSFLKGLHLFYDPSPKLDSEDFFNGDASCEIAVSVTFGALSNDAKQLFAPYIQDESLTVERVFSLENGKTVSKYHGATLQNREFRDLRVLLGTKGAAKDARRAYEEIRKQSAYDMMSQWTTVDSCEENLKQWEANHADQCTRQRDDGQFFGFRQVAQGYLGRFTRFLFIPAVRDAADDTAEGRGSVLTELMDLVVRSSLANRKDLIAFKQETQGKYAEIVDPTKLTELSTLAGNMSKTLRTFAPGTAVELRWLPLGELEVPLPQADIRLVEDGYASTATRTGHGLQRAFILTILQHLAHAQTVSSIAPSGLDKPGEPADSASLPNLVLAIEEPELYQHPNRQRHLAKILLQLATGKLPGVAERTQVLYATHSPLFVGIDRIDQLRLFRKVASEEGKPKTTKIVSTSLDRVAEILQAAQGEASDPSRQAYTGETLRPRLQAVMTPWMSEGFFADVVVLVEGEDDRAALLGVASAKGHELESEGISIIPCGGKTNLDRPATIFRELGIPVYLVWDGDSAQNDAKPEDNRRLLRLLEQPVEDWPAAVRDGFACFGEDLESTLRSEIGSARFEEWLGKCQKDFCIPKKKHAVKNPTVIASLLHEAQQNGQRSQTLEKIVEKVIALHPRNLQPDGG